MSFATPLGSSLRTATSTPSIASSSSSAVRAFSASATVSAKHASSAMRPIPYPCARCPSSTTTTSPRLAMPFSPASAKCFQLMRTVEFEIPKLSAFRQPYTPPKAAQYLKFRFQHYQGENHPASRKVVLNVDVEELAKSGAVKDAKSKHKLLLLAGSRFKPSRAEDGEEKGEIKISCELFPNERQNMKWCSDTLDALVKEANVRTDEVDALPLDLRSSLIRQDKKRQLPQGGSTELEGLPKEWL